MSLKKLFDEHKPIKTIESATFEDIAEDAESAEYVKSFFVDKERYEPHVDYSDPKNFAKFGLAEDYYDMSFKYIRETYPYDGSLYEKLNWQNSASNIDNYIFDNVYPRTTGYAVFSPSGWGNTTKDNVGDYGLSDTTEYILIKSGPHIASSNIKDSFNNVYNPADNREDNLKFDLESGVTVEFWLKKEAYATSKTGKEVVFDMWNGVLSSSAEYGRLRIELTGTDGGVDQPTFLLTAMSGTNGFFQEPIASGSVTTASVADNTWKHYAVTFKNSSGKIKSNLYVNGEHKDSISAGTGFSRVTPVSGTTAYIASLRTAPSGTAEAGGTSTSGYGKLSGSIDEFRYWKTARTPKEIGRHWFTQVAGGTNTDKSNTDLGVYYKFNEGTTGDTKTDQVVLDYSGRLSNGTWTGLGTSSRSDGSAFTDSNFLEFKDPIIRSNNNLYKDKRTEMMNSGSAWDVQNVASLYSYFPEWITEEETRKGSKNLKYFMQIVGSYLDDLSSHIEFLPRLKDVSYVTGSDYKPAPFKKKALTSMGFEVDEIFKNATIIEQLSQKDETQSYESKVHNIRNFIYDNIYNNLTAIYKSKGTEKSFRHLMNSVGVDQDIYKVNLYTDNTTYEFKNEKHVVPKKKKLLDFSREEGWAGSVYQYASSDSNSISYISGSKDISVPITVEAEVYFPKKPDHYEEPYEKYIYVTSSLFGMHTANPNDSTDTTFFDWDPAHFNVYSIRVDDTAYKTKFVLTSSNSGVIPLLTSSVLNDVYENSKWNLAVSIRSSSPVANRTTGSDDQDYIIEFTGISSESDIVKNSFSVTGSMTRAEVTNFLTSSKRLYLGSQYTNFTSSEPNSRTDVRALSARVWMDYLDKETIKYHSFDVDNYGAKNPFKSAYLNNTGTIGQEIKQIDTLALNWEFGNLTGSDSSGGFYVSDVSDASSDELDKYSWIGQVTKRTHPGKSHNFAADSTDIFDVDYISTAKQRLPEVLSGVDMVQILNKQDDDLFTRSSRPVKYLLSIEKSMYQTISEEMLNMFSSVQEFHNLIGSPENKYRPEYKGLEKLRNVFFRNVNNTPDIEKYINFYKWFDGSIVRMIKQLVPASARQMNYTGDMVESHVLERNKYRHKFPTLESKQQDPEGHIFGINELTYNWKFGHPSVPASLFSTTAIDFLRADSKDKYLSIPSNDTLKLSDASGDLPITVSFWVNFSDLTGNQYIVSKRGLNDQGSWQITVISGNALVFRAYDSTTVSKYFYSGVTFANLGLTSTDTWYHMAFTYDGSAHSSGVKIYINGIDKTSLAAFANASYTKTGNAADLKIGNYAASDNSGQPFKGKLDEFAIYESALPQDEIQKIYNSGNSVDLRNLHVSTSRLHLWLRMGDASNDSFGTTYADTTTIIDVASGNTVSASNIIDDNTTTGVSTDKDHYNNMADCLWWNERAERTNPRITSGDSNADSNRETILKTSITHVTASRKTLTKADGTTYYAPTYPVRRLTRPYKFSVERQGLNKTVNKKSHSYKTLRDDDYFNITASSVGTIINCDDQPVPSELEKNKLDFIVVAEKDGISGSYLEGDGTLLAPFNIYTSSIETGYLSDLSTFIANGSKIEINDIHKDTYHDGDVLSAVLQGPFTEKYVGGNFHRHVNLNTGSNDDEDSRREGWRLEYSADSVTINKRIPFSHNEKSQPPYNRILREEYAKRPVSIKNIKHTGSSPTVMGNYEHNYQVVHALGRDVNNLWFRSGSTGTGGLTQQTSASSYVTGVINYSLEDKTTLADGTRNKTIIAERFSAPGGPEVLSRGAQDQESETYSVYSTLNYKNSIVRNALNTFWQRPAGQFGVQSGSVIRSADYLIEHTASYHKTHRNAGHRLVQEDSIFSKYRINIGNTHISNGIQVADSDSYSFGADGTTGNEPSFSISSWVDIPSNLAASTRIILDKRKEYQLGINIAAPGSGGCRLAMKIYDNSTGNYLYCLASSGPTGSQGPVHVAMTYDASRAASGIKFYINGSETSYSTQATVGSYTAMHNTAYDVFFGCSGNDSNVASSNFWGSPGAYISDISMWSATLSAAQVLEIYNSACPSDLNDHTSVANLTSWWKLNEKDNLTHASGVIDQKNVAYGSGLYMSDVNIEKIPPNHRKSCVIESVSTSSNYNNAFLTNQIPRSTRQYSWITASLSTHPLGDSAPFGFPNRLDGYVHLSGAGGLTSSLAIEFLSASEHGSYNWNPISEGVSLHSIYNYRDFGKHVDEAYSNSQPAKEFVVTDFAGMNTNVYEEINPDTNTVGYDSSYRIGGWGAQYFHEQGMIENPRAYFNHWGRYRTPNLAIAFDNDTIGANAGISMLLSPTVVTSSDKRSAGLNAVLSNRQGPYGWPSWKQIRGRNHPIVRDMVKNNRYSVIDYTSSLSENELAVLAADPSLGTLPVFSSAKYHSFLEPPVVNRHRPLEHKLNVYSNVTEEAAPATLIYTYGNNLVTMEHRREQGYNKDLVSKLDSEIDPGDSNQLYSDIKLYYGVGTNLDNNIPQELNPLVNTEPSYANGTYDQKIMGTPSLGMLSFKYREIIYPKQRYTYLNKIRTREDYSVNFWRDARVTERIIEISNNLSGTVLERTSGRTTYSAGLLEGGAQNQPESAGYTASPKLWASDMSRAFAAVYLTNSQGQIITDTGYANIGSHFGVNAPVGAHTRPSMWPLDARAEYTTGSTLHEAGNWFNSWDTSWQNVSGSAVDQKIQGGYSGYDGSGELQNDYCIFHNGDIYQSASLSGANVPTVYGASATSYPDSYSPGFRSAGLRPGALYNRRVPVTVTDHRKTITVFAGDTLWETGDQAGKYPMTNTYAEWAEQIRAYAKEYTVVPEYRISEYMEEHLTTPSIGFTDVFTKWLTITGASIPDNSLSSNTSGDPTQYDNDFYQVFSTTEFLRNFAEIKEEHSKKHFNPVGLKLTCKVAKKFLPYDGFYPAQRAVQVAQLFSQSYGPSTFFAGTHPSFRTVTTPLFAPGILFNTIKSGIAVDYPIHTSSFLIDGQGYSVTGSHINNTKDHGTPRISSDFNYRVPFEALIDPSKLKDRLIMDSEPHPSASINCTASISQPVDKRYDHAINNFTAEIVNFFMDPGDVQRQYYGERPGGLIGFKSYPFPGNVDASLPSIPGADGESVPLFQPEQIKLLGGDVNVDGIIDDQAIREYRMRLKIYNTTGDSPLDSRAAVRILQNNVTNEAGYDTSLPSRDPRFNSSSVNMYNRYSSVDASDVQGSHDLYDYYGSSFGPPVDSPRTREGLDTLLYSNLSTTTSASYEPFTPPYYNGYADYDIVLKAPIEEASAPMTLDNLIKYLTLEEKDTFTRVGNNIFMSGSAAANAMKLSASVTIESITDQNDHGNPSLYIRTKFETPILDFSNADITLPATGSDAVAKGLWHQSGTIPPAGRGVFMELTALTAEDIEDMGGNPYATGSLYHLAGYHVKKDPGPGKVGSNTGPAESSVKRVGELAKSKKIREAVVAIPFFEYNGKRKFYEIPDKVIRLVKAKYFGPTNPYQLTSEAESDVLTEFPDLANIPAFKWSDYRKMIEKMRKYVFPPNFDFLNNSSAQKAAMYIFEFEHTLNQADLADIWQNLPPDSLNKVIGSNPFNKQVGDENDVAEDSWEHNLFIDNFFGMYGNDKEAYFGDLGAALNPRIETVKFSSDLPDSFKNQTTMMTHDKRDVKWLVFKVKQKARKTYAGITNIDHPDALAGIGDPTTKVVSDDTVPYTYNWPYDFFSMIEYAKIEAEVTIKSVKDKFEPGTKVMFGASQMSEASEYGDTPNINQPPKSNIPSNNTPGKGPGANKDFEQPSDNKKALQQNLTYGTPLTVSDAQEQGLEIKQTDTIKIGGIDLGKL